MSTRKSSVSNGFEVELDGHLKGLVIWEQSFLKALTTHHNSRIIRFFGSEGHDWVRINAFQKGLEDRIAREAEHIKSREQLRHFIDQRANLLQIITLRPMKVTDPEQDLEDLFKEMIGETAQRITARTLRRLVGEKLTAAGLEPKLRKDIKVSVPVLGKDVEIPYGYQNGRFNLINPVRFESANPEQSIITACNYAVEGRSLAETPDPKLGNLQLVVVGKFSPRDQDSPSRVRRVFQDYGVKLYPASELALLIEEIRQTAKDIDAMV